MLNLSKHFSLWGLLVSMAMLSFQLKADDTDPNMRAGGELKQGRYVGYLLLNKNDGTLEKIATLADIYLESPEDLTKFPRLNAMFKMSYGGFNTHEYEVEVFEDLRYDFDFGALTFDEPKNDLLMTTSVFTDGSNITIEGQVFVRSAGVFGSLQLKYLTDEPDDFGPGDGGLPTPDDSAPYAPLFDGQYEGKCGDQNAIFQVQTVRGLGGERDQVNKRGVLRHYGIAGRIAVDSTERCGNFNQFGRNWCVQTHFDTGVFNQYLNKATFTGARGAQECSFSQGKIQCQVRMVTTESCSFEKPSPPIRPATFAPRSFYLSKTPAQTQDLPQPAPPQNLALINNLRGTFAGYIHNETNNTYLPLRLNVMAYASTNNPHNPNQTMITTTAMVYFDRSARGDFVTHRFEPRSFYVRPGFTLNGEGADGFLRILEWKTGFIRGEWFSHSFGRVGTVELVKGELQVLPVQAKSLGNFKGVFQGPLGSNGTPLSQRWFQLNFPNQPGDLTDSLIPVGGAYRAVMDITMPQDISLGAYDPYTLRLGWVIKLGERQSFVVGAVGSDDSLKLFWPSGPGVWSARSSDYILEPFARVP